MLASFGTVPLPVVNILKQYELQADNPNVTKAFISDSVDWNVGINVLDSGTFSSRTSLMA
jgi:hypothetical protein